MPDLIQLYTAATPNGKKVSIMLEELGLPYEVHKVDLNGQQHTPEYKAINPNSKIPAIVDGDLTIFESGAILIYLAEKHGRLLPSSGAARYAVLQWLMFQMSGVGPMFGQFGFFLRQKERNEPAIERYQKESLRILSVLDGKLTGNEYIAGDFSIADVATYPWVAGARDLFGLSSPEVNRWLDAMKARPAVERGMKVPS